MGVLSKKDWKQTRCSGSLFEKYKKIYCSLVRVGPQTSSRHGSSWRKSDDRQNKEESERDLGICPKCKEGHVHLFKKLVACTSDQCEFKIWLKMASTSLTRTNL